MPAKQPHVLETQLTKESQARPRRRTSRLWYVAPFIAIAITIAIVVPIAVVLSRKQSTAPKTSIIVPLYIYPDATMNAWEPLYKAINTSSTQFLVIINPNDGPGATDLPDSNYVLGLQSLNAFSNVKTIGYVPLNFSTNSINDTINKVQTYANWSAHNITMHGIFFDEAPRSNTSATIGYINTTRKAVLQSAGLNEQIIVYNPGVVPNAGLYTDRDIIVAFEGSYNTFQSSQTLLSALPYTRLQYSSIVHTIPDNADLRQLVNTMSRTANYIFATSNDGTTATSPYANFSSNWNSFIADVPT